MLTEKIIALLVNDPLIFEPMCAVSETGARLTPVQYNFAGLICKVAGFTPQGTDRNVRLPLSAPTVETKWIHFEQIMANGTRPARSDYDIEIHAFARQLWEMEYGEEAAKALPFYDKNQNIPGTNWWDDIREVSDTDLYAYLRGNLTFRLNSYQSTVSDS